MNSFVTSPVSQQNENSFRRKSVFQFYKRLAADDKDHDQINQQDSHRPQGYVRPAADASQQVTGVGEGQAFDEDPKRVG